MAVDNATGVAGLHKFTKSLPNGETATLFYTDNAIDHYASEKDGIDHERSKELLEEIFSRSVQKNGKIILVGPGDLSEDGLKNFAEESGKDWDNLTGVQRDFVKTEYARIFLGDIYPNISNEGIRYFFDYFTELDKSFRISMVNASSLVVENNNDDFEVHPEDRYLQKLLKLAHELDHNDNGVRFGNNVFVNRVIRWWDGFKGDLNTLYNKERYSDSTGFKVLKDMGFDVDRLRDTILFHRSRML